MGLLSLLCWLWTPNSTQLSSAPHLHLKPTEKQLQTKTVSIYHSPKRRRVTFTLPTRIYEWLEAMAVRHNYGSVHKSVRDILAWASVGHQEDLDWLFGTDHEVPSCLDLSFECDGDQTVIAGSQASKGGNVVMVDARLSPSLYSFVVDCVREYGLSGPSVVLDTLCRCAIVQHASDDIFGSDESGQALPTSSADLYHDLGIRSHLWR